MTLYLAVWIIAYVLLVALAAYLFINGHMFFGTFTVIASPVLTHMVASGIEDLAK